MMAGFDPHTVCARCRDKKKGTDPCVEKEGASCRHCNALTPEQLAQLSMPSYKLKKEKRGMKSSTPSKNPVTDDTLSGSATNFLSSILHLYRAIPHILLRQELFSGINLSVRPNPRVSGMVCTLKPRRTLAPQRNLGLLPLPILIAPTLE